MTKRQRLEATLKGCAVDRPPVSFWRHFYKSEDSTSGLTKAMISFQKEYDWDFLKVNSRASYHGEGWGLRVRFRGEEGLKPERLDYPIKNPQDWKKIKALSPVEGPLGDHLEALQRIRQALGPGIPMVQTIFTPLSIAGDLVGTSEQLLQDLKDSGELVHHALMEISKTFCRFAKACLEAGADGIFIATTEWASRDLLTDGQYLQFGRPYDLQVLSGAKEASFNILHVCGRNNMLRALLDYPVHAINWAMDDPTNPSLEEVSSLSDKALIGGVNEKGTLLQGPLEELRRQVRKAVEASRGERWMLGGGCAIPVEVPSAHLHAIRQEVEQWGTPTTIQEDRREIGSPGKE